MRKKVGIVGVGNVGGPCALLLVKEGWVDLALVDSTKGVAAGKALDLSEACPLWGSDIRIVGSETYEVLEGSDVVVVTAGFPRKPGMTREDLAKAGVEVIGPVAKAVATYAPHAILLVVSNPLDLMCYVAYKESGFEKQRVVGESGVLDSARLRSFIAHELGVSVKDVEACVIGAHSDTGMVPLASFCRVAGMPLEKLMPQDAIHRLMQRTRQGGTEIVNIMGTSAFYAPAASVVEMVKAILFDEKRILPCSVYLEGEYGVSDLFMGVPSVLGAKGVEDIVQLDLHEDERSAFLKSAEMVRQTLYAVYPSSRPKGDTG